MSVDVGADKNGASPMGKTECQKSFKGLISGIESVIIKLIVRSGKI
ncbi:MAG: hypothetical protein ACKO16_07695 [Gemmataceae bacterium]